MPHILEVDTWVEETATAPLDRFYPTAIARATGLPLDAVFLRLLSLVDDGKLQAVYEAHCPDCDRRLGDYRSPQEIPKELQCIYCGNTFMVEAEQVTVAFRISQAYREIKKTASDVAVCVEATS